MDTYSRAKKLSLKMDTRLLYCNFVLIVGGEIQGDYKTGKPVSGDIETYC